MTESRSAPIPRPAWGVEGWPSEGPSGDPQALEAWCYTDRFSYRPGELVEVRVHTTSPGYELEVVRDGAEPQTVLALRDLPGARAETPHDAYRSGCGWPVSISFRVEADWPSGLYLLIVRASAPHGQVCEREHFIVVRAARPGGTSPLALVLSTSTLMAYNDWGGANHYRGLGDDPAVDVPAPEVSTQRPLARGFLRLPPEAPREAHGDFPPPNALPRYRALEWARANGRSRHYASAFWATYERPFVVWAERAGYTLEYLTQHDLHLDPEALDDYDGAVIVGHDEYWSWAMRDAVDAFVDRGGRLARFAGNFLWQVRISDDGSRQTCFKLPRLDPLSRDAARSHLVTTAWDAVGRPATSTMGLSGFAGIYNRYGGASSRSSGGFTVYRPDHWALAGTGLAYGDLVGGAPVCAAAYEVDGVDYTFRHGLPFATGSDGAPDSLEIVAMAPAVAGEVDHWGGQVPLGASEVEMRAAYDEIYGPEAARLWQERRYGSGMVASFTRGRGSVFNAGSAEWVNGLIHADPFIDRITRNVLDHCTRTKGDRLD